MRACYDNGCVVGLVAGFGGHLVGYMRQPHVIANTTRLTFALFGTAEVVACAQQAHAHVVRTHLEVATEDGGHTPAALRVALVVKTQGPAGITYE